MANIPVEKKSNPLAWIIPLILLALLVGLGFLLFSGDDEPETPGEVVAVATDEPTPTPQDPPPVQEEVAPVADTQAALVEPLTSLVILKDRPVDELVGKKVNISNLKVTRVVGDKSFYVTPADGNGDLTVFVFLDEQPTPNTPTEGRYDVDAGDTLALTGFVQRTSLSSVKEKDDMVTAKELESLGKDAVYLHADTLSSKDF